MAEENWCNSPFPSCSLPQNLVEAAEEADLNHEFNASLVVSPLGSGCKAAWLCPTPMAAGGPAVTGAERQPLIPCPSANLCPGFVSEVFSPLPEALREGIEQACVVGHRALGSSLLSLTCDFPTHTKPTGESKQ